jgi:hypothetical protein
MMAMHEDFVIVQRKLFDRMRRHCESCGHFNIQSQDLYDGRVVIIQKEPPSNSRKRKASYLSEGQSIREPADLSQQQDIILRPRTEPSVTSQLPSEPPRSGTEPSDTPQQESPEQSPPHRNTAKKPRRAQAVSRIIKNIPEGAEWRKRQKKLELITPQQYENVIRGLTSRSVGGSNWEFREGLADDNELVAVGKRLASLTKSSIANTCLQKSCAFFQALILLSYCEFLKQKGVVEQVVDELVRTITDTRGRDRKSLLSTVKWINNTLIVKMIRKGWTIYRATELLFISITPHPDYRSYTDHFQTLYLFLTSFVLKTILPFSIISRRIRL